MIIGLLLLGVTKAFCQDFTSLNYFYNIGYSNPAWQDAYNTQIDLHSSSFYNNIPVGVNSYHVSLQQNIGKSLGVSGLLNSSTFGKAQSLLRTDVSFQYKLSLNTQTSLCGGVGLKSFIFKYDETQLFQDYDELTRTFVFGTSSSQNSYLQVPVGVDFRSKRIRAGGYYGVGLGNDASYGLYAKGVTYSKVIKELHVRDLVGVAFYKQALNPKITIENRVEVENFGLNLFYNLNMSSEVLKTNTSFGAGVFYLWKIFNVNYQFATNRNGLGANHQIGLQIYLPE